MKLDPTAETIAEVCNRLPEIRHHLHQHPELSGQEAETSAFVADRLMRLGLEVKTGVGGFGVTAKIAGTSPGRTLAIRADMDALPITEQNDLPYRSQNCGVMHACGHDGHTAVLLGTAEVLARHRNLFSGEVRLLFQPAEETTGGARGMCAEGAMEGVDAIIALHGWPGVAVGKIALRAGAVMASADMFRITVHGSSGHAAYPHRTVDPIAIGAQIVTNLQQISSREADPVDPVVVTVGRFSAGTAHNIIPDTAELLGTYRSLQVSTRNMLAERIRRTAEGICAAHRASCTVEIVPGTPPVVNDPAVVKLLAETASDTFGSESVVWLENSSMGAEDFAEYLAYAPGAMFRLGLGDVSPLHTPTYNWEDRALPVGVELFTRTALRYLCTQQEQPCHAPS